MAQKDRAAGQVRSAACSAGCQDGHPPARYPTGDGAPTFGFWVNAMTSADSQRIPDPRPTLRHVSSPVLVMRAQWTNHYPNRPTPRQYRPGEPATGKALVVGTEPARGLLTIRAFAVGRAATDSITC
jgi:hypothetical protein